MKTVEELASQAGADITKVRELVSKGASPEIAIGNVLDASRNVAQSIQPSISSIPFTSPTGIVSSTTGLRNQEYKNKVGSNNLLSDLNSLDSEQQSYLGTVLSSSPYSQTTEGQTSKAELDQLRKNLGILTPQEEAAITDEGRLAGGQFDDLIRQAEQEKMKGLPKALIRAGEQGGLMNSQFAGAAATNQTVGGDFFGAGGELEEIKSVYDQNIASLKSKREMAVLEARRAARAATLSGKKEDYQLAQQAFKDAQEAHNASIQLAKDKVDAIANYQTKKREGIKFQQEQQATRAKQLAPSLIDVDDSGEILVANNEEILRMAQQEGIDPNTLISEVNMRIDAVMKLNREERKSALEEMKLQGDILNQGKTDDIKEYTFSKQQGYTGSFTDYMKEKKVQEVSLPNSYKEWQLAGSPGTYADFLSGSGVSNSQAAREQALAIMAPNSTTTIKDVPVKQRFAVESELNKLKNQALQSGDIYGVIRASAGGKDASDTFKQSFEKALNVVDQIVNLKGTIEGESTGPIWGIVRSNNPYDTKAQQIKAQITAIVPNLARGVYGEVGVLTDNDVNLYSKTLPSLKSTQEVSEAVLGITIRSVQRSIENKIKSQAGFGVDMSGIEQVYREVKAKADELLGADPSVIQALSKQYGYSIEDVTALISGDGTNPGLGEEQARAFLESQKGFNSPDTGANEGVPKIIDVSLGGKSIKVDQSIGDRLAKADQEMFKATGQHIQVNQSYRSSEQQAELYRKSQTGEIGRAAPPGKSFHEKGLAVDVTNWKEAEPYLRKYGFLNELPDDKGHFSFGEFTQKYA